MQGNTRKTRPDLVVLLLTTGMLIMGCTRTAVPLSELETILQPAQTEVVPSGPSIQSGDYAVVWVPEGDKLTVHNPAGIAGDLVAELPYDQIGVVTTGQSTALGSSNWVEIETFGDIRGWVNAWNLTEFVTPEDFCADPRVNQVVDQFLQSITDQDGSSLQALSNPKRSLIIRNNWWNPDIQIPSAELQEIYQDPRELEWGVLRGGDFRITGSFKDVIYPLFADVFNADNQQACNQLLVGQATGEAIWPSEFKRINYLAFHRPAETGGNPFDWQTWVFGFEYIGGVPYLTMLIHYQGDV